MRVKLCICAWERGKLRVMVQKKVKVQRSETPHEQHAERMAATHACAVISSFAVSSFISFAPSAVTANVLDEMHRAVEWWHKVVECTSDSSPLWCVSTLSKRTVAGCICSPLAMTLGAAARTRMAVLYAAGRYRLVFTRPERRTVSEPSKKEVIAASRWSSSARASFGNA